MRIIFAGTPHFAVPVLQALARQHEVAAVLTQPDRPKGRSLRTEPTPVKVAAEELGLTVLQPDRLNDAAALDQLRALGADAIVVAAYGRILPAAVLDLTPAGCVNIHPSLLPAYRGAAPIQRAIMNGDAVTGVSIMKLDEGVDTGSVYARAEVAIDENETAGELSKKLDREATRLVLGVLDEIERGTAVLTPQPEEGASIAEKISKEEARIDWKATARQIHDLVRALNPAPGGHTSIGNRRVKVWRTALHPDGVFGKPGEVVETRPHLKVGTSAGDISLLEVQPESKGRMTASEFVRGYRLEVGDRLGER